MKDLCADGSTKIKLEIVCGVSNTFYFAKRELATDSDIIIKLKIKVERRAEDLTKSVLEKSKTDVKTNTMKETKSRGLKVESQPTSSFHYGKILALEMDPSCFMDMTRHKSWGETSTIK